MLEDAAGKRDERLLLRDDMETVDLYLSLGSNKGDRRQNIEKALSLLNI